MRKSRRTKRFAYVYSSVAKDSLDLKRSEGGLGKVIFSFLLPMALIWMLLSALGEVIPALNTLTLFSLILGVLSSSMYNWLTEYDIFASYAFLPLKISDMIKSKFSTSPTGSRSHLSPLRFQTFNEKYFEIGMKLNDFSIQLVKY